MKTIILLTFIILLSSPICSQVTLDSSQVTKLIIKLNEREYLLKKDSLSALELLKKDTIITNLENENGNLNRIIFNDDATIFELRKQIAQIEQSSLKWFHYAGASGLILTIGILTGLLIK